MKAKLPVSEARVGRALAQSSVIARAGDRSFLLLTVFTSVMILSAALLFAIQPMFSKMVLPLLGGTPAVWNTAMMFFQAMLLLGYAYVHFIGRRLNGRRQVFVHLVILLISAVVLPVAPVEGWLPESDGAPVLWLLSMFAVAIGLPFFAVSATAPLLQSWFAQSRHAFAADPYFLYAGSNIGSIAALVAYPLVLEPFLGLSTQSVVWSLAYGLLVLGIAGCGFLVFGDGRTLTVPVNVPIERKGSEMIPWGRRLHWLILAFVPSSLLLGVTNHLTTDIAAVPFMWTLPLVLYLLSFVISFSRRPVLKQRWMVTVQPYLIVVVVIGLWAAGKNWLPMLVLHLVTFFVCAMVCHRELARLRPSPNDLTVFYFFMSLGGLAGGVFNSLLAPALFDSIIEYPLALAMACLLRPTFKPLAATRWKADIGVPVALALVIWIVARTVDIDLSSSDLLSVLVLLIVVGVVLFSFRGRPVRFGVGVGAVFMVLGLLLGPNDVLVRERSFFGVHWISQADGRAINLLWNGTTLHGAQFTEKRRWREPLGYYYVEGPFGQIFSTSEARATPQTIGVVGLGTGALACYRRPGDRWTFFEIDPHVAHLATSAGYFHYMSTCAAGSEIVLGDARVSLRHRSDEQMDTLVIDAFSSDAIPIHLLTREAVELYLSVLKPTGVMIFHVSNRHLDLVPVLARHAADFGLRGRVQLFSDLSDKQRRDQKFDTEVVLIAGRAADLAPVDASGNWQDIASVQGGPKWTDDYSNLIGVLKFRAEAR